MPVKMVRNHDPFHPISGRSHPQWAGITIEDERIKKINLDDSADLVGIPYEVFRVYRAYDVADHYRKRHIPVVLSGMHASVMPEDALLHADTMVGKMRGIYRAERVDDLAKLKPARLDLLDHDYCCDTHRRG
jgi:hypothetical protein